MLAARLGRRRTRRRCCAPPAARPARAGSAPTTSPRSGRPSCATRPRILGVGTVRLLDHVDSGHGRRARRRARSAAADPAVVAAEVRAVIDELRPDVVVTLDASDGHRDHAVDPRRDAGGGRHRRPRHRPRRTCGASPDRRWRAGRPHAGIGGGEPTSTIGELGTPDDEITTVVDVAAHLPTRGQAIRAHASQASPYDDLPEELQHEFLATDRLQLVRGEDRLAPSDR